LLENLDTETGLKILIFLSAFMAALELAQWWKKLR
jgi:hypothetical protein